jgi:hypothetical protein
MSAMSEGSRRNKADLLRRPRSLHLPASQMARLQTGYRKTQPIETTMTCAGCNELKPIENKETCLCATCNRDARNNDDLYPIVRLMFLNKMIEIGAKCPITDTDITLDSDIHHMKGRRGYASKEKRMNNITLMIDVDYFLAASREGHMWIEANPEKAKELGYSHSRLSNED